MTRVEAAGGVVRRPAALWSPTVQATPWWAPLRPDEAAERYGERWLD